MLIAGGVPEKSADFWGALQVVYVVFQITLAYSPLSSSPWVVLFIPSPLSLADVV